MPERPRILVLDNTGHSMTTLFECCQRDFDVVRVDSVHQGLELLRTQSFNGIVIDPCDPAIWENTGNLLQAKHVLETLPDGVALVSADLHILWANPMFETWCGGPVQGRGFYEAFGSPEILGPEYSPFHSALAGKSVVTRLHTHDDRYVELHITPIIESGTKVNQLISLGRDVTAEVEQQQKLDALHKVGRELEGLSTDQLADMSAEERIELLKHNIRRFTRDLLHYDVIEIRLLDRQTGQLEPLLQEGMLPEAACRMLRAEPNGQGVTGFVAATGKSYVCSDADNDPLYIKGAEGARSSLTVPLIFQDDVIGTFNVESPRLNAFGEDDVAVR